MNIPFEIKAKLAELAKVLPEEKRRAFVRSCADRILNLMSDYQHTLVLGVAGFVLGEIIDHLLTVGVPLSEATFSLTGGEAGTVLAVAGALCGFSRDLRHDEVSRQIAEIIRRELAVARGVV